ncbi:unnamed protein product [Leptidea sinapis]|uniref:Calponin-homology (CH) domain-containing protein n=1 Tax=Leptidea sinapis TaxID=189913 RepID=A0A5E4QHX1_9NEOP|nr:unnamed protein product [Leptidea sinapis]
MANKDSHKRVDDTRRSTKHTSFNSPSHAPLTGNATIDCLRHKPRHVVDSGYSTDGVEKRWSNDDSHQLEDITCTCLHQIIPRFINPGVVPFSIRISPDGNVEDKSKLAQQQTYRQYKEALRQQRQQDVYRPRTEQTSPELDSSPHSQSHSPVHFLNSSSPVNGYSNVSYNRSLSSNSPNNVPNSPLLHSTPRRFQNGDKLDETKRPVQKVVPSRTVHKYTNGTERNGDYIKPISPTKSPTNTFKSSIPRQNGDAKLLTTIIESRLKMSLPEQLAPVLADGVVLCHLANQLRPRSVGSVHVPSPAQPKLTMARCRRNVDNFLEACRKIGVEEDAICTPEDILCHRDVEGDSNVGPLARTIVALLAHANRPPRSPDDIQTNHSEPSVDDVDCIEVNYERRGKYSEERYISNFNFSYTFDEAEETCDLEEFVESNDGLNRVQYVAPFYKADGILTGEDYEIYDTDEVDFPTETCEDLERYDREKMKLEIEDNLNELRPVVSETANEFENRIFFTILCLGGFLLSTIFLILYPL